MIFIKVCLHLMRHKWKRFSEYFSGTNSHKLYCVTFLFLLFAFDICCVFRASRFSFTFIFHSEQPTKVGSNLCCSCDRSWVMGKRGGEWHIWGGPAVHKCHKRSQNTPTHTDRRADWWAGGLHDVWVTFMF